MIDKMALVGSATRDIVEWQEWVEGWGGAQFISCGFLRDLVKHIFNIQE